MSYRHRERHLVMSVGPFAERGSDAAIQVPIPDGRRTHVLLALAPLYLRHLLIGPYRRRLSALRPAGSGVLRPGIAAAGFDTCVELILRAYRQLAGHELRSETGAFMLLFMRLVAALDEAYESRLAARLSLNWLDVLHDHRVASHYRQWLLVTTRLGACQPIVRFMDRPDVAVDYQRYVAITTRPSFATDFHSQLESMRLDSGGYLAYLAQLIALFHGRQPIPDVLREFSNFGMAGKIADDLVDLYDDYSRGRHNLLWAISAADATEFEYLLTLRRKRSKVLVADWQAKAPKSFDVYVRCLHSYYQQLHSDDLRLCCQASLFRALKP
jgi:hypothetical protein